MSVEECFGALCSGCALVLRTDEWIADAPTFWRYCVNSEITVLNLPTAFWHHLVSDGLAPVPSTIRQIMVGGEKVNPEMVARWFLRDGKLPRLINAYGPTEVTVNATLCQIEDAEISSRLIGRPILNTQIYILDSHRQLLPIGAAGEIYIGGASVARGYLNLPRETAERFVANPFSSDPKARIYRTGDVGRFRPDGSIEYLGRNDHQVKVRGFRIEVGEIERRLAEHPSVREAAVLAREDRPREKRLVAYVTMAESPGQPASISIEALRTHLAAGLPDYMVPAAYVRLATFPLTSNGKLDRKALPAPDVDAYIVAEYEPPMGEVENTLARIWAELLNLERVGRHDNFFELGGHSLLAVTLIERMRRADFRADVRQLFATPTLAALADSTEIRELVL
jgi:acyl-coenzyme A synthetase/AMP-(fatty) acid ligase/aryl carrier-like protein